MTMRIQTLSALAAVLTLGIGSSALAQTAPDRLTLMSGAPGGSWYPLSAGIAEILTEGGAPTTAEPGAANSNILNVASGTADIAFTQTNANWLATQGLGIFKEKVEGIVGLAVLFPQYAHTVVTVESGVTTYEELKGRDMASQSLSAGSSQIFNDTLRAHGMAGDEDLNIVTRGGPGVGSAAVRDRQVIGFVATTAPPTAAVSEVAATLPIRLLPIGEEAMAKLQEINPGYAPGVIPGGLYTGVDEDVPTLVDNTVLLASVEMSDDEAYWIVKTLAEAAERITGLSPAFANFSPEVMAQVRGVEIHPGARRYYEEIGVLK